MAFNLVAGAGRVVIEAPGSISLGGGTLTPAVNSGAQSGSITLAALGAANEAPTFTVGDARATTAMGGHLNSGADLVLQPDGKIVVAGESNANDSRDFALVRYNANGSLDTTFDGDGRAFASFGSGDYGRAIVRQADGKLVVAGYTDSGNEDFAIARYNANGSLDTTFDGDGRRTTDFGGTQDVAWDVAMQSDGKIVVVGNSTGAGEPNNLAIARYLANGSLDASFSGDGLRKDPFDYGVSVEIQADGKILVAGLRFGLARYNADGTLDTSFSGDGATTTPIAPGDTFLRDMVLQPDGKILLVGSSFHGGNNNDVVVVRYDANGTLDTTFDGDGIVYTDIGGVSNTAYDVVVQPDGKIVVAGSTQSGFDHSDFLLVRYNANGSVDRIATTDFDIREAYTSIALQPDGKIIAGANFSVVRYNSDLSLDSTFGPVAVNTLDGAPTYTVGGPAVVLDGDVRVYDADLAAIGNYGGSSLTLARRGGANAEDVFSAAGSLAALTQGAALRYEGVTVGTVTTNAGGRLVLTFNSTATQWYMDGVLQSIAYSNSNANAAASIRIDWLFSDGNTGAQGSGGALPAAGSVVVEIDGGSGVTRTGDDGADALTGSENADTLNGRGGDDTLTASGGNDVLVGGPGNDRIDGGNGYDVSTYDGRIGSYSFVRDGATLRVSGNGETDFLTSIERINFDDGVFDPLRNARDFQGDGRDDVLLRSSAGDLVLWALDGSGILDRQDVAHGLSSSWRLFPADPTGDGHADLFLYGNGALVLWRMRDGEVVSSESVREGMSPSWNLNAADFTGDGQADVLLNHASGAVVLWEMNGATVVSSHSVREGVSAGWQISAADMNGDGQSDVLLRHANGALVEWEMREGRITESRQIHDGISASWDIFFADVNGDRQADAVLHDDATGALVIWEMLDGRVVDSTSHEIGAGSTLQVGHYTGDSGADILSRNPSGEVFLHELNGAQQLNDLLLVDGMSSAWTLL